MATRYQQPQGGPLRLDRSNPLTAAITTLIPAGVSNYDIVSKQALTLGAGASIYVDSRGRSLKGSGAAAVASIPVDLSVSPKVTASFWLYWDAYANDYAMAMEYTADGGANPGFYISPNGGGGSLEISASGTPCNAQYARPSAATWHHYLVAIDRSQGGASGIKLYVDGVLQTALSAGGTGNAGNFANSSLFLLNRNNTTLYGAGRLQNVTLRGGYIGSGADAVAEYRNPWQLFAPTQTRLVVAAAGSGSTGTLARTNGADASAAAGTTTVVGSVVKANGNDSAAGAGSTTVTGSLARSNANDSVTAAGAAGAISGTVAVTNRNDTSAVVVPVVVVNRANEWYGYLKSYEQLNKPKRKYKANEPQIIEPTAKPAEIAQPDNRPLLAQQMLAALQTKALKEGAQASHAFIERLRLNTQIEAKRIEAQRAADEQDEEDALMLLFN